MKHLAYFGLNQLLPIFSHPCTINPPRWAGPALSRDSSPADQNQYGSRSGYRQKTVAQFADDQGIGRFDQRPSKKLVVGIVPDAYMIRVALESENAQEAATIVNAVVESYRKNNDEYTLNANTRLRKSLADEEKRLDALITQTQASLKALIERATFTMDDKDGPVK